MNRTRASSLDAFGTRDQRNRIYPALEASDGSTLTLDFTQMSSLDSRFTFDRSSSTTSGAVGTATFINSSGYVQSVAAGVPRFDYNPTTLAPRGLLIEGSATNLLNWSESFQTTGGAVNWNFSAVNTTRGTVTTTNPTGSSGTVVKVEETTTNGVHATLSVPTASASTAYTFSVWAKAVERTFVQLYENGGSSATNMVNLSNGNIVSESVAGNTRVTAIGTTGWYRIEMRFTTAAGQTSANCQMRLSTDGTTTSYAGTTGSGIYVWGAQLEAGNGASSYIPTTTAAVTRAADQCFIADASPFQVSTTNGTLYWSGIIHKQTPGAYTEIVGFMDSNSPSPRPTFEVFTNSTNIGVAARGPSLSSGGPNEVYRGYTLNAQTRYACSVNTTSDPIVAAVLNGGTVGTINKAGTGDLYASTKFVLGRLPTTSYGNYMPCMTFAQVKYWPVTKTQTELNLLTTT